MIYFDKENRLQVRVKFLCRKELNEYFLDGAD